VHVQLNTFNYTRTFWTEFFVPVCFFVYLDDDLAEVENWRRDISDKKWFIIDLQFVGLNTA